MVILFMFFISNIYYIDVYICWDWLSMLIAKDYIFVKFLIVNSTIPW